MPRNVRGGKHKHIKRSTRYNKDESLPLASEQPDYIYGMIQKKLGVGFEVLCSNGKTELAIIRGKFRKKVWMNVGDIVLVDRTEIGKFIIVHKYTPEQARQLKSKGEIVFDVGNEQDSNVVFEGDKKNSSSEDDEMFQNLVNSDININNNTNNKINDLSPEKSTSESSSSSEDDSFDEQKEKRNDNTLVNRNKLLKQFGNKSRGNNIVRERIRAAARDKKDRIHP